MSTSIETILDKVNTAPHSSPIAVYKTERGFRTGFASTVQGREDILNYASDLIGVYHRDHVCSGEPLRRLLLALDTEQ